MQYYLVLIYINTMQVYSYVNSDILKCYLITAEQITLKQDVTTKNSKAQIFLSVSGKQTAINTVDCNIFIALFVSLWFVLYYFHYILLMAMAAYIE